MDKRKDKSFFERISNQYDIYEQQQIYMTNLLANPNMWVGDMVAQDSIIFYRTYWARFNNIENLFAEDVTNLIITCKQRGIKFIDLFQLLADGSTPIFKFLQRDTISYETFILLDSYFNFIDKMTDDFVWASYKNRVTAYRNFFFINRQKVVDTLTKILTDYKNYGE